MVADWYGIVADWCSQTMLTMIVWCVAEQHNIAVIFGSVCYTWARSPQQVGVAESKHLLRIKFPNERLAEQLCSSPQHCAVQASGLQMNVFHCCSLIFVCIGAVLSEVCHFGATCQ
jgi:hypothetical protein